MKNYKNWELESTDINSSVCSKCIKRGPPHCCEISIGPAGYYPKIYLDLIERAVEGYDHLRVSDTGEVFLICSHLDKEKGECTIYETRPQNCRDYNCVSVAKVDFSRGHPEEQLYIYNKVVDMFREEEKID
jgi:Fe-S-cluster containining protein